MVPRLTKSLCLCAGVDRFSQPYFFDPSVHAVVAPLPGLGPAAGGGGEGEGFEPVRYGDYLMERLDANYSWKGKPRRLPSMEAGKL